MSYGWIEKKMKQNAFLVLAAVMVTSLMMGLAWAQPTIEVSPSVVKPGESIIITGQSTAGATLIVEVSNTRTLVDTYNITANPAGTYSIEYQISSDSPVDIYTVRVQDGGETIETSFIVSKMTQQQLANTIRTIVENAKRQAESALIQARKQGFTIPPEIRNKYQQGLDEIGNAGNSIQNNNYAEAQESLREALNRFREVVEYSYSEEVAPPIDPDQNRLRVQEMIDQLTRQYNDINAAVQKLKQNGLNVDVLEKDLNTLRNRIGEAQALLDEGMIAEAEQTAARTRQLVQERLAALRLRQVEITKRLAESYQSALKNRIDAYVDTFRKLQAVRPVQSALALQELESLQLKLTESSKLLDQGNIAVALREIHNTEFRLKRLKETVNGNVTSRLLNRIDELTANLQESTGADTSQIEKEIEDTKNTLNDYLRQKPPTHDSRNSSLSP
jgi:hypothetical protein